MRPMFSIPVWLSGAPESSLPFSHSEFQRGTIKNSRFATKEKLVLANSFVSLINCVQFFKRTKVTFC